MIASVPGSLFTLTIGDEEVFIKASSLVNWLRACLGLIGLTSEAVQGCGCFLCQLQAEICYLNILIISFIRTITSNLNI